MSRYVSYRDFDWLLLTFVLLLCGLGVMEIQSATVHTKFAGAHIKQLYWIAGGVAGMFLFSLLNYQALLDKIHWMYIGAVGSLMAVMVFGQKYLGARRWIKMPGGQHFQPSEWVKLILILAVAKYFADMHQRELTWTDFIKAGAMVGVPMLRVLAQTEALPEGASGQLHRARSGQARFGVPSHPIADCRWLGWIVGRDRNPDSSFLSARAPNRLYFRGFRRGARIRRSSGGAPVIPHRADAVDPERSDGARPRRNVRGDGCGGCA